jgi:SAM-dependent methyltransferase
MAEAVAANPPKADYGLDAPVIVKRMFTRGGWAIGVGLLMWFVNHDQYPAVSARILAVLGLIGVVFWAQGAFMIWSSRVAKLALRDRLLDSIQFKGDEKVLDVGCGRGLMLIGAAKRLKSGKTTGIDIWNQQDLSGNSADAVKQNAKIEGVSDRVRIETSDARKLVYPDGNYDVVMSTLAIHNIPEKADRDTAIREMWRVLKPGGRLLIYDIFHTGAYAKILREQGATDVTLSGLAWLWCIPSRSLLAKK